MDFLPSVDDGNIRPGRLRRVGVGKPSPVQGWHGEIRPACRRDREDAADLRLALACRVLRADAGVLRLDMVT